MPDEFYCKVKGLEREKEGGARCPVCFRLRLEKTAKRAKELGYDCFGTTLTVSPHKNAEVINAIGKAVGEEFDIEFIEETIKNKMDIKRALNFPKVQSI